MNRKMHATNPFLKEFRLDKSHLRRIAGLQLTSRQPCWGTTTKRFPPLGTKLFYHANSAKKFFIVLTTNMAALSRGCKRSILQLLLQIYTFLACLNSRGTDIKSYLVTSWDWSLAGLDVLKRTECSNKYAQFFLGINNITAAGQAVYSSLWFILDFWTRLLRRKHWAALKKYKNVNDLVEHVQISSRRLPRHPFCV